jgi:site-specific DNA-methyltransferase (adenine-specific)
MSNAMPDVTLHLGDCLDVMGQIPDGSVDLILADLPYGTTACKWDVVIPFEPLWAHYRRALRPRGAVVLTASQPFTSMLVMSNREWFKYSWVWEKNTVFGNNARHRPMGCHEDIVVFSPAKCGNGCVERMTYNPQGLRPATRKGEVRLDGGPGKVHKAGRKPVMRPWNPEHENFPRSVLRINAERGTTRRVHPTQKPIALGLYLIRTYSNPGDAVLDNCMGSGSFIVAAIEEGRDAIGIERDPEYHAVASRRIAEARATLFPVSA